MATENMRRPWGNAAERASNGRRVPHVTVTDKDGTLRGDGASPLYVDSIMLAETLAGIHEELSALRMGLEIVLGVKLTDIED